MTNPKGALAVAAAVVVIAAGSWLWFAGGEDGQDQQAAPGTATPSQEAPATGIAVVPKTPAEDEASSSVEVETPTAAEESETQKPSFDIVRVEPSGETVIAGRAAPGTRRACACPRRCGSLRRAKARRTARTSPGTNGDGRGT